MFLLQIVNSISVWLKRLAVKGSYAIAFLNEDDQGRAMPFDIHLGDIGLTNANGYNVTDVFDNIHRGQFKPASVLSVLIDPTSIVILKAVPLWATNSFWLLFFLLLGWVSTHMQNLEVGVVFAASEQSFKLCMITWPLLSFTHWYQFWWSWCDFKVTAAQEKSRLLVALIDLCSMVRF